MRSVFRQLIEQQAVNPYISGHVTDGSSTFTFSVSGNQKITVPVDANGDWKWLINTDLNGNSRNVIQNCDKIVINAKYQKIRIDQICYQSEIIETFECNAFITMGRAAFAYNGSNTTNLKELTLNIDSTCTDLGYLVRGQEKLTKLHLIGDTSNVTKIDYLARKCPALVDVFIDCISADVDMSSMFFETDNISDIGFNKILKNLNLSNLSKLTEQSIINIFNAVATNGITLTFHGTVYGMIQEQLAIVGSDIYNAYYNKIQQYNFTIASA